MESENPSCNRGFNQGPELIVGTAARGSAKLGSDESIVTVFFQLRPVRILHGSVSVYMVWPRIIRSHVFSPPFVLGNYPRWTIAVQ